MAGACGAPAVPDESIVEAVAYVLERGYKRVTLQFPDDMLEFAPAVAGRLQDELAGCTDAKVRSGGVMRRRVDFVMGPRN